MKVKMFAILFSLLTISLFVGCSEDTITEAVLGENSVTVTGNISKSFDAITVAGMDVADTTTSMFVVTMRPKSSDNYTDDNFSLFKLSDIIPPVGNYNIIGFTQMYEEGFFATYSANDSTVYLMNAGSVEITESSNTKVSGTFDVSGVLIDLNATSPKEITVKGKFSTIPADMN